MRSIPFLKLSLLASIIYSSISFGAILNVQNGILFGATGIDINGVLYDVSFQDGTCAELYDGCDQNSDFPFANPQDLDDARLGLAANAALIEQVFIDSPLGAFDSNPALTNGCAAPGGCQINTPLFLSGNQSGLGILWAFNRSNTGRDIATGSGGALRSIDTRLQDAGNYAVWSQSTAVPLPAAVWLFGSGLIGLLGLAHRRTNTH